MSDLVCFSPSEQVSLGFLVAILSPMQGAHEGVGGAGRLYRDLINVNRDGLACVLAHLNHLVIDKYLKMYPATKQQLMWLIRELIRASVAGMETVCWNLMRQVAGGDVSKNNLWLADILVRKLTPGSYCAFWPKLISAIMGKLISETVILISETDRGGST